MSSTTIRERNGYAYNYEATIQNALNDIASMPARERVWDSKTDVYAVTTVNRIVRSAGLAGPGDMVWGTNHDQTRAICAASLAALVYHLITGRLPTKGEIDSMIRD